MPRILFCFWCVCVGWGGEEQREREGGEGRRREREGVNVFSRPSRDEGGNASSDGRSKKNSLSFFRLFSYFRVLTNISKPSEEPVPAASVPVARAGSEGALWTLIPGCPLFWQCSVEKKGSEQAVSKYELIFSFFFVCLSHSFSSGAQEELLPEQSERASETTKCATARPFASSAATRATGSACSGKSKERKGERDFRLMNQFSKSHRRRLRTRLG